ncbi:MAG: DUF4845 domain-containing protein [Gammaproteobacteria bacterium]|nr:DUF4845 domain-containing protein [Gammaproteobacteria bacterium]
MRINSQQPKSCEDLAVTGRAALRRRRNQAGMTTLGLLILVVFMGMFGYAGIRLAPIYLNYVAIASVIDGVRKEYDGQNPTRGEIKKSISRRFDIENISLITARDVKVTSSDGGFQVAVVYDHKADFVGNVSFSVHFDKKALVRR